MVSAMFSISAASIAICRSFVTRFRKSTSDSPGSTARVVVPLARKIVSPVWTSCAAAAPMRSFSAVLVLCLTWYGDSCTNC